MENCVDFVNDYIEESWKYHEDDTLLRVYIDGYPEDNTKSGTVIAIVSLTRRKDLVVDWHRNDYRLNENVKALIDETKIMLLQQYDQFAVVAMNTEKKNELYTWDEISKNADGAAWDDRELRVKNNAREQVRQFVFNRRHRDLENEGNPEESVDIYCDICAILFDRNGNISQYDNTALQTKLQKIKVGDAVFCFDKNCDFAYEERKVRIERVKKDNAYKSDVNPEGIVLVGRDITIDEDGKSIFMVTDDNFIRMAEFVDEKNLDYVLTSYGKENVEIFIDECAAKRKEILVAGIDTAEETNLPSEEDILSDLNCGVGVDEDGDYYNRWGITDHYDSDTPISLRYGIDFVCKLGTKIIRKSTGETGVIIGIYDPQVELGKKLNPEDHPIGFMVRMKGKDCYDASLFIKEFEPVLE
ncbi:hypothetical protein [Eubacterium ramulus]|uniref:hypothetical protein n=1 Tax=Eubacterium ramulus TaxID=39490 RepID=UPI0022E5EDF0|nr:hypothetical protein [Eubacterium ramulus]